MIKNHHKKIIENMLSIFDLFKEFELYAQQILSIKSAEKHMATCKGIAS